MIEVKNLTKRYGRFVALDSINFTAQGSEILGFLGPNGAGKTTTMRILTGYMPPSEGIAKIAGFDVLENSLEVRQHVGYLPETVPLYRDMSVHGYLRFIAKLRGLHKSHARIDQVLEQVGMQDRARSLIRNLSKGMRQRVGLAQAILHDPEVLILDEPTIGLDPHQVQDLRELIRELGQSHTVMLSTHILSEAEQICDRVVIIDRGQIVAEDTPEHLRDRLHQGGRLYVRVGERAKPGDVIRVLESVSGIDGVEAYRQGYLVHVKSRSEVRPALAAAIVGHSLELIELRPWANTLEEIFLELTTQLGHPTGQRRSHNA